MRAPCPSYNLSSVPYTDPPVQSGIVHLIELASPHLLFCGPMMTLYDQVVIPDSLPKSLISVPKADQFDISLPQPQPITVRVPLIPDVLALRSPFVEGPPELFTKILTGKPLSIAANIQRDVLHLWTFFSLAQTLKRQAMLHSQRPCPFISINKTR